MGYDIIEVDGVEPDSGRFPVSVQAESHAINGDQHSGILDDTQIPESIMRDSEHTIDPHTMTIDGRDVSVDGAKLDTIISGAQPNNLSDQQAQSLTSGMHSSWHHHDDWYYRESELQTSGLAAVHWDNITNKPSTFEPSTHEHDDLYYTESEVDAKIAAVESFGILGGVDTFADLPGSGNTVGDVWIVRTTVDADEEGFYKWDGSWTFLANNTGSATHNHDELYYTESEIDSNFYTINDVDSLILTPSQLADLTDGGDTVLHNHDAAYYGKSTVDALLNTKSDSTHNHDDRYYIKTSVDSLLSEITFSDITNNDPNTDISTTELEELTNGSNADHLHTHESTGGGSGTLTEAYNYPTNGAGRVINVDAGPITLSASDGFAPLKLTPLGSAPTEWLGGGELTVYNNELYLYDASRSKWLSTSSFSPLFNDNKDNDSGYMKLGDTTTNSANGFTTPWNCTIVGVSCSAKDCYPTASFDICNGGSTVQTIYWGSQSTNSWDDINIDFNVGDVIQVYGNSDGERPDRPLVFLFIKKRI